MDWQKLETIPQDRPVMLARWLDVSPYNSDNIKEGHWVYDRIVKWQAPPEHDRSVVCVSLDRQFWIRGGTTVGGKNALDWYRWAEIPALPEQPAFS